MMAPRAHRTLGAACLVASLCLQHCQAAPMGDRVRELPGLQGEVPFPMYSGLLDVGGKYFYHYEFHGSRRSKDDPVVLWQQGGPGASSISIGALTEMGAFQVGYPSLQNMTNGVPNLIENPYAWNKVSNMLYFDHPPGVGNSYCYDSAKKMIDCPTWTDTTAAEALAAAIVEFFEAFSEFQGYNFYMSGESYSGIYVPATAYQLSKQTLKFRLKGLLVGNGCINVPGATESNLGNCNGPNRDQIYTDVFYYHSMISTEVRDKVYKACKFPQDGHWRNLPAGCNPAEHIMSKQVGHYNQYFVNDNCPGPIYAGLHADDFVRPKPSFVNRWAAGNLTDKEAETMENIDLMTEEDFPKGGTPYNCGAEKVASQWITRPEVLKALHLEGKPVPTFFNYTSYGFSSIDHWPGLIEKYRTTIYNGVADTVCPWPQNEAWVNGLNYTITSPWSEWFVENGDPKFGKAAAGYHRSYISPTGGFLSYVAVKDAGHMVPQYQPKRALEMLTRFLDDFWP